MEKKYISLIVFVVLSLVISYIFHKRVKNFLLACILIAVSSSILYQVIGIFVLGYLDPFFYIALAGSAVIAFGIAVVAGLPFAYLRFKEDRRIDDQ